MYNIKMSAYVPAPSPATSDRIVAAHYYAAWKKGAAGLHNGFEDLHDFPDRTPLMGYYDEENPEVCDWEIKWALEHGINCFIYCWYRKLANMGKPVTLEDLRCPHGVHEALFHARYGNQMKFAIMFENSPRWGTTDGEDLLENLMPFWMETYFKRDNYLKIDNKPVLFTFWQQRLSEVFPNPQDQKRAFDACREYARGQGFDGMVFGCADFSAEPEHVRQMRERGYDFCFGYSAGYLPQQDFPPEQENIAGQLQAIQTRLSSDPMHQLATASCFWDPTPRFSQHWIDMGYTFHLSKRWYVSPEGFREVLRRTKAMTDALPDGAWAKKILMIDNWNEWDEGHFVAPSLKFGFGYLQAIREELTLRDNLPDYRMPQELGLTGYNKSWKEPGQGADSAPE